MDIKKDVYLRMNSEIRKELTSSPGAFKAWMVCVLEGISAEELYARSSLRELYGVNRHTVYDRKELINKAHDEYVLMSAFEHYDI